LINKESCVTEYTTNQNDNDKVFESSGVVYYNYYYLLNNSTTNNSKLCNNRHYLILREHYFKWIEMYSKPDYLKIIYQLVKNKLCHVRGLVKLFHDDIRNVSKKLDVLQKYSIIERVNNKEKYENLLYAHRKAFNIDDWHFKKAEWYKLTDTGNKFFSNLDFNLSLHPTIIEKVDNYKSILHKTHKQLEIEIEKEQKIIKEKEKKSQMKKYFRFIHKIKNSSFPENFYLVSKLKKEIFEEYGVTPNKEIIDSILNHDFSFDNYIKKGGLIN